jgi:hypothetical protein
MIDGRGLLIFLTHDDFNYNSIFVFSVLSAVYLPEADRHAVRFCPGA